MIYVGPHPSGCAIFRADGQYLQGKREVVAFRAGDIYWRDGTRSVRTTQQGFEEIVGRRITSAKVAWLDEQRAIQRRERAELEAAFEGQRLVGGPLGGVSFDLETGTLTLAALELLRRNDSVAMRHLLNDALARARSLIERALIEPDLQVLLDQVACLAAVLLEYEQDEWFERVIGVLARVYSMPIGADEASRFDYSTWIDPGEKAPRVWLEVIERIFGLGALAVRRGDWRAIRKLTLRRPEGLSDYHTNWIRHAITMTSRAQHLREQREGQTVEISLLSIARSTVGQLECLRPDGLAPSDEGILTSLAQFDVLSNIVAIDGAGETDSRVFYTNFARFRQSRVQQIVERLVSDRPMREALFTGPDDDLARALSAIGERAIEEGWRFDGFDGWKGTPVERFILDHP